MTGRTLPRCPPAAVTLGVRYMTTVISVCIVFGVLGSHPCGALALGAGILYYQVGRRIPLRQLTLCATWVAAKDLKYNTN